MFLPVPRQRVCTLGLLALLSLGMAARSAAQQQPVTNISKQIAPKADPSSSGYRSLPVSYHYDPVIADTNLFDGSLRVHLCIGSDAVLPVDLPLVAEVKLTDLRHSDRQRIRFVPVVIEREVIRAEGIEPPAADPPSSSGEVDQQAEDPNAERQVVRYAHFELDNRSWEEPLLGTARVYRLFVNLHRRAESQGKHTLLGRVPYPYYTATSGATRLDRARRKIVMRTFKEFYYRLNGWRTGEKYPMDCYAYYMWATGFCTVGAENGRTQLHNLFGKENPYNLGSHIPELSGQGPIHGDYVRMPGHSFMLLGYDARRRQVWTMEGNFNSTVEVAIRSVGSSWQVGHLRDGHILPSLFRLWKNRPRLFGG